LVPPSPITKLILVRFPDGWLSPLPLGGEHAGETGVSLRTARWLPRPWWRIPAARDLAVERSAVLTPAS